MVVDKKLGNYWQMFEVKLFWQVVDQLTRSMSDSSSLSDVSFGEVSIYFWQLIRCMIYSMRCKGSFVPKSPNPQLFFTAEGFLSFRSSSRMWAGQTQQNGAGNCTNQTGNKYQLKRQMWKLKIGDPDLDPLWKPVIMERAAARRWNTILIVIIVIIIRFGNLAWSQLSHQVPSH